MLAMAEFYYSVDDYSRRTVCDRRAGLSEHHGPTIAKFVDPAGSRSPFWWILKTSRLSRPAQDLDRLSVCPISTEEGSAVSLSYIVGNMRKCRPVGCNTSGSVEEILYDIFKTSSGLQNYMYTVCFPSRDAKISYFSLTFKHLDYNSFSSFKKHLKTHISQ